MVSSRLYFSREDSDVSYTPILGRMWPSNVDPTLLPFSQRTRNALSRSGRLGDTDWLARATAAEFFALRGIGARSLLDFATVVEAHSNAANASDREARDDTVNEASPSGAAARPALPLPRSVEDALGALRLKYPIEGISSKDPRLHHLYLAGETIDEALIRELEVAGRHGQLPLMTLEGAMARIREIERALEAIANETLDEALGHLLEVALRSHLADAVAMRLGWDGRGGCTLQRAGDFGGVSRERIRQLEARLRRRLEMVSFIPALDHALLVLEGAAVAFEPDAAGLLKDDGVTSNRFLPSGVVAAAEILGRDVLFRLGSDGQSVHLTGDPRLAALAAALRSLSDVNHVATVSELQARVADHIDADADVTESTIRPLLDRNPQVVWLDRQHRWFWLRQKEGRNRWLNQARKILSVTDPVSLSSLREGLMRHHRSRGMSITHEALEGLCRAVGFVVSGGCVSVPGGVDPRAVLGTVESKMATILAGEDCAMSRSEFQRQCLSRGVNRHSFWVYLAYSPIFDRLAPSVYALRGREVDPAIVAQIAGATRPRSQVVQDHGWTADRSIWIGYRANQNLIDTGVATVPSALRRVLGMRRFELYAADGARTGTFSVGGTGQAWSLSPFIDRRGLDVDDALVVLLDTNLEMAIAQSGSRELLTAYQEGEGPGVRRLLEIATEPDTDSQFA